MDPDRLKYGKKKEGDSLRKPTVSFEFFPPKNEAAEKTLWESVPVLSALDPQFMTVTYGAGGTAQSGTLDTVRRMARETGLPIAAHLTFINTPIAALHELTDAWWAAGIRHIVALRGDMPADLQWPLDRDADYFQYTSTFVKNLKSWNGFEVSVGAYPEKHPDADNHAADIEALKRKCDAGADRAITQFFFDNACYYRFVDECRAAGITVPICPGLLPIHDFAGMKRFAGKCQASVPAHLNKKFEGLEGNPGEAQRIATDLLAAQAQDLAENGVEHIHFYTLNKAAITAEACAALGYKAKAA
jgi:methylenetetrahydrofolate reductase (NADPH)